jgi:hypothetical protein
LEHHWRFYVDLAFFYEENLISVASLRIKWEQWEGTDLWANLKNPELGIQKKFGPESISFLEVIVKFLYGGKFKDL